MHGIVQYETFFSLLMRAFNYMYNFMAPDAGEAEKVRAGERSICFGSISLEFS